jgi:segregation and condensation protein A
MKPDLKLVADTGSQLEVDVFDPPPQQAEMPFAVVDGEPITQLPKDLYIPPDALQVFLEAFEGPLDLLLYLIRRQNLDVLDIPIAEITRQYMHYIDVMQELQLELAGEYLLMAAMLAEIKSRMLLPHLSPAGEEEEDPRAELVRRLQEYERFKKAAADLDRLPRMERDTMAANVEIVERKVTRVQPQVSLHEMLMAFKDVLSRADMFAHHHIRREQLSVRQRMSDILDRLRESAFIEFVRLFDPAEGRMGVTVTFIAVLELMKEGLLEIVQAEPYAPIHVRPASGKRHLTVVGEAAATVDFDTENAAALAQPAHPDENDDPDDEAPSAEVAVAAAPSEAGGESSAGEQASLQIGEPGVVATAASSAEAVVVAQPEAAPSEVAVTSADVVRESVVAQVGAQAIPAPEAVTTNATVTVVAESAVLDDPAGAAAQQSAGAILEPTAVASSDAESALQGVELLTRAPGDAVVAVPEPAALAEPAVAASEVPVESLLPEAHAALAESPSLIAPAAAEIVFHADASDATAEVVADAESQVEADGAAPMPALAPETTLVAGTVVELEADQPAPSPTISLAASDLDVAAGFEVQRVTALEDAESAATDPVFEHIDGAAPIHVDAGFIQGFTGPLLETDLAMVPLATDASHELPAGTLLLLESPAFEQFPSDTRSETQLGEPTDSVGAILESESAALSQLVAYRVETQVSADDAAALGTSPAEPVAEGSATMAAEPDAAEHPAAPALTDTEVEPPVAARAAFDVVGAEVNAASDVAGADAEAATAATLQLEPWIASEAADSPPVADELLADVATDARASLATDQEPESIAVGSIVDQPATLQLSDPGSDAELPAMTVVEAVDAVAASPAPALLDAWVDAAAVTRLDLVAGDAADELQAAASEVEASADREVVASESLDGIVDIAAAVVAGQEPEQAVGALLAEPSSAPQLSDPGLEPAPPAFEAVEVAANLAPTTLLEADAEPAAAALDLASAVAADAQQAAASEVEAAAGLEVVASELLDAAADAPASLVAGQEPEPAVGASLAEPPSVPQLSDLGVEPELPAMTAFEAAEAEPSATSAALDTGVGPTAVAALDLVPDAVADTPQAAEPDIDAAVSFEFVAGELLGDVVTDAPAAIVVGQESEHVGDALAENQTAAPQQSDSGFEPGLPAMTVFEAVKVEAGDVSALLEAQAEAAAVTTVDVVVGEVADELQAATPDVEASAEPEMPTAAPEVLAAATIDSASEANGEIPGSEWFDDFVIDVPALGALQYQLEQGVVASLTNPTDSASLHRTGREADVPAMTAFPTEVGAASIGAATEVVAGSVLPDEGADSLQLPDAVAVGAPPQVEPAAAAPAQAGEAVVSVSETGRAVAVARLELESAASMAMAAPLSQAATFEAADAGTGQGEPSLAAADVDVPAVTSRSGAVVEPAGFDRDGALPAAASLATEPVVAVASAVLPEPQPSATTTPPLLRDAEPQVAVALSATRDAGPPLEQLRRGSVTALLDDYPVGAMQWETRETNSVESAYEVDVAAFSSPLAFEHHLLRDDSD